MAFSAQKLRPYIVPILATIGMIVFAYVYEADIPFWWVFSFIAIFAVYGYLYQRSWK
jgi:hypothetical protein